MGIPAPRTRTFAVKTIVMGDGGVGKSNIISRGCYNTFKGDSKMTIGAAFHIKDVQLSDDHGNYRMMYQLWDLGGQDRFRIMMPQYCYGARACIAAFDVGMFMSLEGLKPWFEILYQKNKQVVPTAIIATKYDLFKPNDTTKVKDAAVAEFIEGLKAKYENYKQLPPIYIKTSAKTGLGIEDVFREIAPVYTKYITMPFAQ